MSPTPTPTPGISLVKRIVRVDDSNRDGVTDDGDTILWAFDVTNTGDVDLIDPAVQDPMLAAAGIKVECPAGILRPGAVITCTAKQAYRITSKDARAGKVKNTATATASESSLPVKSNESSTVTDVLDSATLPASDELPLTGFNGVVVLQVAAVLLAGGLVVVVRARRRTPSTKA